ncbi:DUF1963 domain-containing protein [Roseovarius sp.]|uniref:DUF1963 domain-containing protein n=1 Tax=Roseovarius sp. TaxID=1486281 RepID=UPI003B5AF1AA
MSASNELSQEEIARFAYENGRMALSFIPELPTETCRSFVGGYPRLPVGMSWPVDGGVELMFLAQIDLADLPWRPEGWPSGGTLYLFHNPKLQGADHNEIAFGYGKDGTKSPARFVYFASGGCTLETVKPTEPHSNETFFQYFGEGYYQYGKLLGPKLERDCLPYAALRFAPHVQYYPYAWFDDQAKASGLDFSAAYERFGEAYSYLHDVLEEQQRQNYKRAVAELGVSWYGGESEEQSDQRIYGGAPLIDVDGLLQKLPDARAIEHFRRQSRLDSRYTSWPESGGMVMRHAMSVASSLKIGRSKEEKLSRWAQRCTNEATEWAHWGHQRARKILNQVERDSYLAWARSRFRQAIKIYARSSRLRPIRKYLVAPIGKAKRVGSNAGHALSIARALVGLCGPREFGLRLLSPDQILAMPDHAHAAYLTGTLSGQLFGWGNEIQTEVRDNADRLCLAVIYGNPDIEFEADFKIWLPQPINADTWQPVMVVNEID